MQSLAPLAALTGHEVRTEKHPGNRRAHQRHSLAKAPSGRFETRFCDADALTCHIRLMRMENLFDGQSEQTGDLERQR